MLSNNGSVHQNEGGDTGQTLSSASSDDLSERTLFTNADVDTKVHIVIVGGSIGAFSTALALADLQNAKVTIVNVGLGLESSKHLGMDAEHRGLQLCTRTVSLLESLGIAANFRQPEGENNDILPTAGRPAGVVVRGFSLHRYDDGELLTRQAFKALPPQPGSKEVPCLTVDSLALRSALWGKCLQTPNIDVRPRCMIATILREAPVSTVARHLEDFRSTYYSGDKDNEVVDLDGMAFGVEENGPEDIGSFSTSKMAFTTGINDWYSNAQSGDDSDVGNDCEESSIQMGEEEEVTGRDHDHNRGSGLVNQAQSPPTFGHDVVTSPFSSEKVEHASRLKATGARPVIILTSGERIMPDVILDSTSASRGETKSGVDIHSEEEQKRYTSGWNLGALREDHVYRAHIAMSLIRENTEFEGTFREEVVSWLGPGRHVTCFPVNGGKSLYISVAGAGRRDILEDAPFVTAEMMKRDVEGWCSQVVKLVSLAERATLSSVVDYTAPDSWLSNCGRIALIGNAAHPLLPFAPGESTLTIEDAVTLRALFQKLSLLESEQSLDHAESISLLLQAFVSLRRPRCTRCQIMMRTGRDLFWIQDGEAQTRRDAALREGGLIDDEEEEREHRFDPIAAVESWWVDKGRHLHCCRRD